MTEHYIVQFVAFNFNFDIHRFQTIFFWIGIQITNRIVSGYFLLIPSSKRLSHTINAITKLIGRNWKGMEREMKKSKYEKIARIFGQRVDATPYILEQMTSR